MPPPGESPSAVPRGLIITFVFLVIAIIGAGYLFYQSQEQQITDKVTQDLTTIALLKGDQIAAWREDRLYDARVISSGPFFIEGADHFLTQGDNESREKILTRFREMNTSPHYQNVLLVDPEGNVRLSLDPAITSVSPVLKTQVTDSLKTGTATMADFNRVPGTNHIHLDVIAPLVTKVDGSEKPIGAVLLSIDPDDFLYPLIQSWPVPSGSAETLLVEREGDHVLFLNDLRHMNNTALNLTIPLSQTQVPSVRAVLGTTGFFPGRDYRGVDVVSFLGPVPGSPWYMVAKIDTEEAYSGWRNRSVLIVMLIGGTLAGTFIIAGLVWQRRQKYYYRTLYAVEAERSREEQKNRERLETLVHLAEMESAGEQELADFILDAGCRLTDSLVAFIGVMSPDETVFDLMAWSKSATDDCSVATSQTRVPIETAGIWAESVRKRQPFIVNDYPRHPAGKKELLCGHIAITRSASVPIFEGQRIVMVCTVANKGSDYTVTDTNNLTLLMQGVWNHLRKRSADEALRQKTTDLEAAYEEITSSEEELQANYEELGRSQRALVETTKYLTSLFDYANAPIIVWDPEFRITRFNHAFEHLTGRMSDQVIGQPVEILFPGDTRERSMAYLRQATGGERWESVEIPILHRDGSRRVVLWNSATIFADDGTTAIATIAQGQDITDRKRAEDSLRESERLYRSLFENMLNGFAYCRMIYEDGDPRDFTYLAVNRAFGELTGLHDVERKNVSEVIPGIREADPRLFEIYGRVASTGSPERFEIFVESLKMWFSISVYSPQNGYFVAIFDVITDRKMAEEALRESEHRFRSAFELAAIGMSLTALDGRFLKVNRAFMKLTGYSEEELLLLTYADITYPEDIAASETKRHELLAGTSEVAHFEKRYVKKDGRIIIAFVSHILLRDEDNRPQYFVTHIQDITERKRAEDALRETNEYLRKLIDYASAPIIVWDPDFIITRFNHAFEHLTGRSEQEALGQPLQILFPEESRSSSLALIRDTLEGGRLESVKIPILALDGTVHTVLWNSANILTAGADLVSTIAQGVDITKSEQAEVQREMLIAELEQKNTELERFTYTASHDLKSPLITIKGFAGLLEDDAQKGDLLQLKKDVQRITSAAETMQALLTDLLELSRVGRIANPPENTGFGTIVHEAVDLLAGPLAERGVRVEIAPHLPDVFVDHTRIREAMINLIENSVKFFGNQPDPVIRVGMDKDGETPVFFVEDNGIGIDPRYLERIFNLFEKLDPHQQGTGIGLTIVRRIVEVHGGKIWAESEGPGKGTTFRFTLPLPDTNTDKDNNG